MRKAQPVWREIPPEFKRNLVGYLDYKSRCRLRRVSKDDKKLVDSCPAVLKSITLDPPHSIMYPIARILLKDVNENPRRPMMRDFKEYNREQIISDAVLPLVHKNSLVDSLHFYRLEFSSHQQPDVVTHFFRKLMTHVQTFPEFKIRTKRLKWDWETTTGMEFFEVFKLCDPSVLRILEWYKVDDICYNDVVESEQWKNLKYISIIHSHSIPIDHFLHCDRLFLYLNELTPEIVCKLFHTFLARDPPVRSFFRVYTDEPFDRRTILRMINVPRLRPALRLIVDPGDVYQYELPNQEHVLMLSFQYMDREASGLVCRREHLNIDYLETVTQGFQVDL